MTELETMLKMQGDFQLRLDPDIYNMSLKERVAFIKEHSIHLNQEINEMLYELPFFKPWKDYSNMSEEAKQTAMQKARIEMVDAWHFFMNIMIGLGFTADEFYQMYCAKNAENHRRQDEGYTADKSYKDQKVEDVMKPQCTVVIGGEVKTSANFIAALIAEDGSGSILTNSDLVNLGILVNVITKQYWNGLNNCSEETRVEIEKAVSAAAAKTEVTVNE